jgi:hypothetical protein
MLTIIVLVLTAWLLISLLSGVAVGTFIRRLDTSVPASRHRPPWKLVPATRRNGLPVLLVARTGVAPSRSPRR